jgi:alpha-L-fucosidase
MSNPVPAARQMEFQNWEFGLFIHFGVYTYKDLPGADVKNPAIFNPSKLDCDQWIQTARNAGMRYAVMTSKHHDGFCLWPTRHGSFSVKQSPWKNGKGDVVREFTDACRRHDMKIGIYYSPYDMYAPLYKNDPKGYDDYFIGHMRELMGHYGKVDIIWFDGANSEGHTFDWPRISAEIRKLQPDILFFSMGDPDFRWIGNEFGLAPAGTSEIAPVRVSSDKSRIGTPGWLPAEADCRMRRHSWGWDAHDEHTVKSVDELMGLYYYSVGRGTNLLLNIGPDPDGLLPEKDASRLIEFGAEIKRRFSNPVATFDKLERMGNRWIFQRPEYTLIDCLVLQEDIGRGERVKRFALQIHQGDPHTDRMEPITIYEGTIIGHKAIVPIPPVAVMNMVVNVLEADGEVHMRNIEYHCTCKNA